MSTEDNKAIVRRWNDELWKGNQSAFNEFVAPNCLFHGMGGPEDQKKFLGTVRTAFPDLSATIEDQLAEGDKVVTRWILHGTHQGEWLGNPPTGKPVSETGITINRIAEGKIVEEWSEADSLGVLQQIRDHPTPTG